MQLSYQTAGESHGPGLLVIVAGLPAGLRVDHAFINAELRRRQGGYGRGGRQNIETDAAEFLSGVRQGETIGSPVAIRVANADSRIDDAAKTPPVHTPRPGHADLAGSLKYLTPDCRGTLERASARETAARVAAGALARCLLREIGIEAFAFVRSIKDAATDVCVTDTNWRSLRDQRDASDTACPDAAAASRQHAAIHAAKADKDTLGGIVECCVFGCPPGIGSTMDYRDRLDARIAAAVMGIQAIKAVEIGLGLECAARPGSQVHDPIGFDPARRGEPCLGYTRTSNHAGGIEGGMSNGQPIVVRAAMKPISTLLRGMPSVDLRTKAPGPSAYERSDICAVPAASVVVENVVAFEVARAAREKFGGDTVREMLAQYRAYLEMARGV